MVNYDPYYYIPHFNFFLNTITINYPPEPTEPVKKIYFELLNNFGSYIPTPSIRKHYNKLLDKYPLKPYLDNKNDFEKWILIVINSLKLIINEKPHSFIENKENYNSFYLPKKIYLNQQVKKYKKYIIWILIISLFIFINKTYF